MDNPFWGKKTIWSQSTNIALVHELFLVNFILNLYFLLFNEKE